MVDPSPRNARMLLGDEAVAQGALDAGVTAAYAYPGTPSTEIFEYLEARAGSAGVAAHWTANEKTAYEAALGVSMVGRRAFVSMKHVGLNVAMDPFVNSALVRLRGGLVLAVADDPSMHSSQNEQDSRWLAAFARLPCLEPATEQEAYDMAREAFDVSERFRLPVVLRLVTRLCHGRARVLDRPPRARGACAPPADPADWVLLPGNARRLWQAHLDRQPALAAWAAGCGHDVLDPGRPAPSPRRPESGPDADDRPGDGAPVPLGIVTTGLARGHYEEVRDELDFRPPHLHIGAYPLPEPMIRDLASRVRRIVVLEEGYPLVERALRGILPTGWEVGGRESGTLPPTGELTPESVRSALGLSRPRTLALEGPILPDRPPQLCPGCPHRDVLTALRDALDGADAVVTGDIGCYTLGALPPWSALDSCVCMGASIGMARGAADAGAGPVVAVIGDSTFLHSGMPPLVDAVAHDTPMTVLILDNGTVAMTGQQPTVLRGSRLLPLVLGLGVDEAHVHQVHVHPRRLDELRHVLRREIAHPGLSVVLAVRECVEAARKRKRGTRGRGHHTDSGSPDAGGTASGGAGEAGAPGDRRPVPAPAEEAGS